MYKKNIYMAVGIKKYTIKAHINLGGWISREFMV